MKPPKYLCLVLPFPPTTNNLFVNNPHSRGRYQSAHYKEWRREAARALASTRGLRLFDGPVALTISLGRPDKRKRDLANFEKALTDALVRHGVLTDDSLIEKLTLQWSDQVVGAMIEIEARA